MNTKLLLQKEEKKQQQQQQQQDWQTLAVLCRLVSALEAELRKRADNSAATAIRAAKSARLLVVLTNRPSVGAETRPSWPRKEN